MLFGATRVCLAFDASGVCGARVATRLRGLELRAFARAPLPAGALRPGAADANLGDADAVQRALRQVAAALDLAPQSKVRVVLPDGLARLALLEQPSGVASDEFARFRLAAGLPYAADEAVVGSLPAGRRRLLAAAVRRGVAAEYEAAVRAAGVVPEGVFLAPFVTLAELLRRPPADDAVVVVLGDTALALAAFHDGRLTVVRSRRRDGARDEPARIGAEVERTASAAELRELPRVTVHGGGARALAHALGLAGHRAEAGRPRAAALPDEAAEWAWLGAAA
jgi:hypothetical protein